MVQRAVVRHPMTVITVVWCDTVSVCGVWWWSGPCPWSETRARDGRVKQAHHILGVLLQLYKLATSYHDHRRAVADVGAGKG